MSEQAISQQCVIGTKGSTTDGYSVTDGQDFVANMSFDGGKTYTQVTSAKFI